MSEIIEMMDGSRFDLLILRGVHENLKTALESGNESILGVIREIAKNKDRVFVYHIRLDARTVVVSKETIALLHEYTWFPSNGGNIYTRAAQVIHTLIVVKEDNSLLLLEIKDIVRDMAEYDAACEREDKFLGGL